MTRLVEHDATGPLKLDESDLDDERGNIAVCRCGLSAERPFCDGSHRQTTDEDDDGQYWYEGGERSLVELVKRDERES